MAPSSSTSLPLPSSTNSILPALHHASSGSIGTLISTCALYPLSLLTARLQVQRQLRRRGQQRERRRPRSRRNHLRDEHVEGVDRTKETQTKAKTKTETETETTSTSTASVPSPATAATVEEEEEDHHDASARGPRYSPPTLPSQAAHTSPPLPVPRSKPQDHHHHHHHHHHRSQSEEVGTPGQQQQQTTSTTSLLEKEEVEREEEGQQSRRPKRQTATEEEEEEYAGIVGAFSQIWNSNGGGGLRAFYTGLAQDAPKSVLDSFLFFLFYEWFRALRLRSRSRRQRSSKGSGSGRGLGVAEELAVGVFAGACSRFFTTPIANIVTRKQTATLLHDEETTSSSGNTKSIDNNNTVRDIARSIYREKGLAGFWSGYSASLVLTLNPSLTFFLQEFLRLTFAEKTYDDPGPRLTFLFAATSKAVSSFVTYPFQIAKTRLQAGIPLDDDSDSDEDGDPHSDEDDRSDESSTSHDDDKTEPPPPIRAIKTLAKQSVFGTVAHIIRTEGIRSLYDGVGAELLKGFFSHGTTMLAKDVVHKGLFKLYILILGVLTELRRRRQQRSG
ncbi:mitochondrial carrier domain-containing protein [Xylaria arbuscula]|nr:mitochondrial carrier domain-containing protein [Xylaria arbuscula]